MRKIIMIFMIITTMITMYAPKAYAESYEEKWLREKLEEQEKRMDELAKENNLTQETIDSISKNKSKRKPVTNNKTKKTKDTKSKTSSSARGWVYGTDELHVIGLPENEDGYTQAGDYGKIEVNR